jgi:hypothetical protein
MPFKDGGGSDTFTTKAGHPPPVAILPVFSAFAMGIVFIFGA